MKEYKAIKVKYDFNLEQVNETMNNMAEVLNASQMQKSQGNG